LTPSRISATEARALALCRARPLDCGVTADAPAAAAAAGVDTAEPPLAAAADAAAGTGAGAGVDGADTASMPGAGVPGAWRSCSSSSSTSLTPAAAAQCSGVSPKSSRASARTPLSSTSCTALGLPLQTTRYSSVRPLTSAPLRISRPFSRRRMSRSSSSSMSTCPKNAAKSIAVQPLSSLAATSACSGSLSSRRAVLTSLSRAAIISGVRPRGVAVLTPKPHSSRRRAKRIWPIDTANCSSV
jgi:hypothetical protein